MNEINSVVTAPPQKIIEEVNPEVKSKAKKDEPNLQKRTAVIIVVGVVGVAVLALLYEVACIICEVTKEKLSRTSPEQYEKTLTANNQFSEEFIQKIKSLKNIDGGRLIRRLALSSEDEKKILQTFETKFKVTDEELQKILMGAHVVLEDDAGEIYKEWEEKLKNKKARISSHPADDTQYGLQGGFIRELLFSRVKGEDGQFKTWCQMESYPTTFGSVFRHSIAYIKYKISNENQGPYGSSPHTDKNPLVISLKSKEKEF